MRPSIKRHIYLQFFTLSLLTIILLLALLELISEDLEENIMALEMQNERNHFSSQIGNNVKLWETSTTQAAFVPEHVPNFSDLPPVFQGLSEPYSGAIEWSGNEYWVDVSATPTGILYIARNISLFEQREEVFLFGILALGGLFIVFSFVMTQLSTRRIVRPLMNLTREVASIEPEQSDACVDEDYRDEELHFIAKTFNSYINTMHDYVKREHSLIGMASHELRTPISVISGALDVLDDRDTLTQKDKHTLMRIRIATNEMQSDVEAILMLARKQSAPNKSAHIRLSNVIQSVLRSEFDNDPQNMKRISVKPSEFDHRVAGDISLIKILLKNLIKNALEHTHGGVTVIQNNLGLLISDEGMGLPKSARLQLGKLVTLPPVSDNESGLGLFITTLICERLNWRLEVNEQLDAGTHLQIHITTPAQS